MALKRATLTRPSGRAPCPDEEEGAAAAAKPGARARAERPSVRILVVVANIQMRTLKAEEGKGFMKTALAHGLADPKGRGKPVRERVAARAPKGNRVKIP